MSKTKIGVFGALLFSVTMLLIPATSIASATEYDRYGKASDTHYQNDRYYGNEYEKYLNYDYENEIREYEKYQKDYNKEVYKDKPTIIIENKVPVKKKVMKEPPMILVNKEVLFCDVIANGTSSDCVEEPFDVPGPDSPRYVQDCNDAQCQDINSETFGLKVTDDKEFQGSEDGTKVSLDGKGFVVEENSNLGTSAGEEFACVEAGFDSATFEDIGDGVVVASCVLFEGECSGEIRHGELKECTVKNYVFDIFEPGI